MTQFEKYCTGHFFLEDFSFLNEGRVPAFTQASELGAALMFGVTSISQERKLTCSGLSSLPMESGTMGASTPEKLANAINQGYCPPPPPDPPTFAHFEASFYTFTSTPLILTCLFLVPTLV